MFDRSRELPITGNKILANSAIENIIWAKFHRIRTKNEFNRNSATYNL